MDCRLVELPLSIKCMVKDGVIYLNARHSWAELKTALEEARKHLSNIKTASTTT